MTAPIADVYFSCWGSGGSWNKQTNKQTKSSRFSQPACSMLQVLLTVSDHSSIGAQLILIVGQRLAHSIFSGSPAASVDKLSNCQPLVSTWLKTVVSVFFYITTALSKWADALRQCRLYAHSWPIYSPQCRLYSMVLCDRGAKSTASASPTSYNPNSYFTTFWKH